MPRELFPINMQNHAVAVFSNRYIAAFCSSEYGWKLQVSRAFTDPKSSNGAEFLSAIENQTVYVGMLSLTAFSKPIGQLQLGTAA